MSFIPAVQNAIREILGKEPSKGINPDECVSIGAATRTFLGTPGFLKAKFGIPIGSFTYPSTKERLRLSEAELKHAGAQGALLAEDSFTGFAQAAAGGRTLRSASVLAAVLSLLAGSVGLLLMSILAALPAYETATAVNLLLFEAAWLAPTLLLSGWTRHF